MTFSLTCCNVCSAFQIPGRRGAAGASAGVPAGRAAALRQRGQTRTGAAFAAARLGESAMVWDSLLFLHEIYSGINQFSSLDSFLKVTLKTDVH